MFISLQKNLSRGATPGSSVDTISMPKMCRLLALCAVVLLWCSAPATTWAYSVPKYCADLPPQSPADINIARTCGDGVVQPENLEVCDDGNRRSGDGCNGWCTAFDRYASACTIAGDPRECPNAAAAASSPPRPSLSTTPALTRFCSLSCLAVAKKNESAYIYLADGGSLLRYSILVDNPQIQLFPATSGSTYTKFCGIFPLSSGAVVAHECSRQEIIRFEDPMLASGKSRVAMLPILPTSQDLVFKGLITEDESHLIMAGNPSHPVSQNNACIIVTVVHLAENANEVALQVPCTLDTYPDLVIDGRLALAYDITGMQPTQVYQDKCPPDVPGECFVVQCARADLHSLQIFISVEQLFQFDASSLSPKYYVSRNTFLNAWGTPIQRRYHGTVTYTLRGACLTVDAGSGVPKITFGATCASMPVFGSACARPLVNPWATDVFYPPFLLPKEFTSQHTQQELERIFDVENLKDANVSGVSGVFLFQQMLQNLYSGTVPLDFAPIPGQQDIVYITKNGVHFLSSKGFVLQDYQNPPYCLVHNTVLCPTGYYASVGQACKPCALATDAIPSPAEQMQCVGVETTGNATTSSGRRRLLSVMQNPPYVSFALKTSSDVDHNEINVGVCLFLQKNGISCGSGFGSSGGGAAAAAAGDTTKNNLLVSREPSNMNADADMSSGHAVVDSIHTVLMQTIQQKDDLIEVYAQNKSEYTVSFVVYNTSVVDGLVQGVQRSASASSVADGVLQSMPDLLEQGVISKSALQKAATQCSSTNRHFWRCVMAYIREGQALDAASSSSSNNQGRRRRLLQQNTAQPKSVDSLMVMEQNSFTVVSNTPVYFGKAPVQNIRTPSPPAKDTAQGSGQQALVIIIGIVAGVAAVVIAIAFFYWRFVKGDSAAQSARKRYQMLQSSSSSSVFADGDDKDM